VSRLGNWFMTVLLRTPVVQRALGRSLALLTFQGRRTATTYTIPVSYGHDDGALVVLTRRRRVWWRNLLDLPRVRLRVAGRSVSGHAVVHAGSGDTEFDTVTRFLTNRKIDAKGFGVSLRPDGTPNEADVRGLLPEIVVIRITPTGGPGGTGPTDPTGALETPARELRR
jgi:hypothetical protein